jgi:MFS transporter, ACS family, tartrate transporter
MDEIEQRTIRKTMKRLIPFLIICYFVAYLDRVNIGFANLHMSASLGLGEAAYGLGAGLFFIGYFFFEVPSNILLEKFGARRWIARIMITWGLISGAFAFIPNISAATGLSNEWTFYVLRLVLGAFEAGFYPGVIFYITLWFPAVYRGRVISLFMLAIPISNIIGSPISGALLSVKGLGFEGWQWLFILEAIPSVLVGIGAFFYLTDAPSKAKWLRADEIVWLQNRLETEKKNKENRERISMLQTFTDSRVLACALIYFCSSACAYGLTFFLPTIIKSFGASDFQTGFIAAIPFAFGAIGMILMGRHSDKHVERRVHVAVASLMAAVGIGLAAYTPYPVLVMALLCFAQIGISATPGMFWPMPASILSGAAAASGIALINALGGLAGFLGPFVMGYMREATGDFRAGLTFLAVNGLIAAVVSLRLRIDPTIERRLGNALQP